jgi:hypothetical protein
MVFPDAINANQRGTALLLRADSFALTAIVFCCGTSAADFASPPYVART